jgi:hypothetical protein
VKLIAAMAAGYLLGARAGRRDLDQLTKSLKALCQTDEFADVVTAARLQLGATLRELAAAVEGQSAPLDSAQDLVATVRRLVEKD